MCNAFRNKHMISILLDPKWLTQHCAKPTLMVGGNFSKKSVKRLLLNKFEFCVLTFSRKLHLQKTHFDNALMTILLNPTQRVFSGPAKPQL